MSSARGDIDPGIKTVRDVSTNETVSCEMNKLHDNTEETETSKKTFLNIDIEFDTIIGYIEDMLIGDEFHELQMSFLEKYWKEFVDTEENKHEYMTIFMEYVSLVVEPKTSEIETFIKKYITKFMPHFQMEAFVMELEKRRNNLDGEVFEMLFTLTDFNVFKEMFLDYRMMYNLSFKDSTQRQLSDCNNSFFEYVSICSTQLIYDPPNCNWKEVF